MLRSVSVTTKNVDVVMSNTHPPDIQNIPALEPTETQPQYENLNENEEQLEQEIETIEIVKCCHLKHFSKHIQRKLMKLKNLQCSRCISFAKKNTTNTYDTNQQLVLCLKCGAIQCSRNAKHSHGIKHYTASSEHCLSLMIPTQELYELGNKQIIIESMGVWCYKCDIWLGDSEQDQTPKFNKFRNFLFTCFQRLYKRQSKLENNNNNKYETLLLKQKKRMEDSRNRMMKKYENLEENKCGIDSKWLEINSDSKILKLENEFENGFIGIVGLSNLGNTCFFNSIVQNLLETRPLIQQMFDQSDVIQLQLQKKQKNNGNNNSKNITPKKNRNQNRRNNNQKYWSPGTKARGRLMSEFFAVANETLSITKSKNKRSVVTPSQLLSAVVNINRRFAGRRQQDSHELMRVLVEGIRAQNEHILKKECKKDNITKKLKIKRKKNMSIKHLKSCKNNTSTIAVDKIYTVIDNVFGGEIESSVTCYTCLNTTRTIEEFFDLSLPISKPCIPVRNYSRYGRRVGGRSTKSKKQKRKERNQQKWNQNKRKNKKKIEEHENDEDIEMLQNNKISNEMIVDDDENETKVEIEIDENSITAEKQRELLSEMPSVRGLERLENNCNLLDCLSAFTDPEILEDADAYRCRNCTIVELQKSGELPNDDSSNDTNVNGNESGIEDENDDGFDGELNESKNDAMDDFETLLVNTPFITRKARKQILISKAPNVLVLHLKRFSQGTYGGLSKVGKRIRFPLQLNLSEYLTPQCQQLYENNECLYQLYGISVHHGSMGGGHYIAYTHKHRENGPKEGWYYFSDSHFRHTSFEDVMNAQAYILFYQKC